MATINLNKYLQKVDNEGTTPEGELTAEEFKEIIRAIQQCQNGVKKIVRNGVEYTPNADGTIEMTILSDSDLPAVRLVTSDNRDNIISTDGTVKLHLRYTSVVTRDGISEDTGHDGTLLIQRKLAADTEWLTVAELPFTPLSYESESYREVDISSYLLDGDQQLRIRVTDNDAHIDSTWLTFASVVKTQLAVEFISSWQNAIQGGAGASTILSYILLGAVEKELHLVISGKTSGGVASTREIVLSNSTIASYTGRNNPFSYTLQDLVSEACKIMSVHGVHTIEAWLQTVADPDIQSEHIFSQIFIDCDPADTDTYILLQGVITQAQNYVTTDILQYGVHSPSGAAVPLTFTVGNYAGTAEYMHYDAVAENGIQYTLHNTIEVEGNGSASIDTYLRVTSGGTDLLTPSIGSEVKLITIDNSVNFAPTSGADFFLNPKTRNNTEEHPDRILNAAQGNAQVAASFRNFGFVNDGWVTDDAGQRCLRIRAGQYLDITGYEPFQAYIDAGSRYNNQQASCTIELDMAVRNITNEDDPIIKMCSYLAADGLPLGLEMKPLEGVFMTRSQRTFGQQNFAWREGVRTHIAINCYYNLGAAAANETQVSYVRIFINGKINREFLFDHSRSNEFWQNDGNGTPSSLGIRIGQDEADIDIYGIRIYQKALSSDDVQQDYVSTMPSAADKLLFKAENDIMQDGVISYAKAAAKYNVIVWHGEPVSGHNQDTKADKQGYLYIQLRDANGDIDRAHSGTLTTLTMKGQGTTAKHYYEWNDQWQWKNKASGNFTDLDGVSHGQKYQMLSGLPWAKKLVGKINYASSMQSHKAGACNLYNDLYMRIVNDWSIPKQEGYENTRVTVPEIPCLYFVQRDGDSSPVFQGLMTFGPGKGDKPTWGYNETDFPMMAMMEGSDNNFPLTDQRVPWRDEEVKYNADEEYFEYNGEGNIDFDFGAVDEVEDQATGRTIEVPKAAIVAKYADAWNFCYRWNPLITFYDGTLEDLKGDPTVNTKLFYWVTQASASARKFDLFRLDYKGKDASNNDITEWVPAGLTKTGDTWDSVNLMDVTPVADTSIWESMNQDFIAARVAQWKLGAPTYFSVLSLQFHQSFSKLMAGTDNRSKNTYYVLDPVTLKIHCHQDDLDTILRTNNTGWQMKPYYIEEHDTDDAGNTFWEGQYNVLFKLTELAYADALPQMMNTILSNMAALVGSGARDRTGNLIPQTPEGCFQKYFYYIQEYFPAVTYNETARIRYEAAQLAVARNEFTAPDGINPITQSLGDQLEAEKQYIKRRLVYLSSYAAYGEFSAGGTDGSLSIRGMKTVEGADAPMVLTIKTHQWLYPTGATGGSLVNPHVRLAPGGRLVDAYGHPYGNEGYQFNIGTIIGDTSCKLSGINYMRSIGNVASLSTNPAYAFTVSGERLVEFIAEPAEGQTAQFRPSSVQVVAPNLRTFSLKGCDLIAGECALGSQTRLQSIDLRGTGIVGVVLPQSETLTEAHLPSKLSEVIITNTAHLATLTVEGFDYMQSMSFTGNWGSFDLLSIVDQAYQANAQLSSFTAEGVQWRDVHASMMDWLVSMVHSTLTGTVSITGANTSVTFDLKKRFLKKWGAVDSQANPLYITYALRDLVQVLVVGDSNIRATGAYAFSLTPATVGGVSTPYGNKFTAIAWSLSNNAHATVDPETGVVTATSLGQENADGTGPTATLTATVTLIDGTTMQATKTIRLYDRSARVKDYVFADGTYSDINDGTKTAIGICWYINPDDPTERLMVAMNNAGSGYWGLFNHSSYPDSSIPDIVLETGYNAYDTPMDNVTSVGVVHTAEGGSDYYISDATYRDESDTGDADGFRKFAANTAASHIGFMTLPRDFHGRRAGERIPYGEYETLIMIDHRDEVLGQLGYDIPAASASETEMQSLLRLIAAIQADGGEAKYAQFYYQAASLSHAYEPTILRSGEVLADKFKAGKWFTPSGGDLTRLYWYHSKGYNGGEHAIFSDAYQAGLFTQFTATYFWSSLEYGPTNAWYVYFGSGTFGVYGKNSAFIVRAVAAF